MPCSDLCQQESRRRPVLDTSWSCCCTPWHHHVGQPCWNAWSWNAWKFSLRVSLFFSLFMAGVRRTVYRLCSGLQNNTVSEQKLSSLSGQWLLGPLVTVFNVDFFCFYVLMLSRLYVKMESIVWRFDYFWPIDINGRIWASRRHVAPLLTHVAIAPPESRLLVIAVLCPHPLPRSIRAEWHIHRKGVSNIGRDTVWSWMTTSFCVIWRYLSFCFASPSWLSQRTHQMTGIKSLPPFFLKT